MFYIQMLLKIGQRLNTDTVNKILKTHRRILEFNDFWTSNIKVILKQILKQIV